ncbi:substrate-binding domain-containing protein [Nonomuraea angiospora]|nr:substrate-binding domain-containing protein [Nonomuraea angiospora]MDX3104638.1 substrate-binding domain-containing protein [Nonomuraea angiospora]
MVEPDQGGGRVAAGIGQCGGQAVGAPQVTNVAVPAAQLGSRAAELAVAQLEGETVEGVTLIGPTLTVRGSSAPMRAPRA